MGMIAPKKNNPRGSMRRIGVCPYTCSTSSSGRSATLALPRRLVRSLSLSGKNPKSSAMLGKIRCYQKTHQGQNHHNRETIHDFVNSSPVSNHVISISYLFFEYGQEGFLGNFYFAHHFHTFLTLFLFVKKLHFTRDIAAVEVAGHIFAEC